MMRKSHQTQPGRERRGRVREDNPYTVVYMKQSHRALGHLCSLSIQLSLPLLSRPLGSAFSVFLQSHPETPRIEVTQNKGCIFIRGGFWTKSVIAKTLSFYIQVLPVHREDKAAPCRCSGRPQSKPSYITKAIHVCAAVHRRSGQHLVSNSTQAQEEHVLQSPAHRQTMSYQESKIKFYHIPCKNK